MLYQPNLEKASPADVGASQATIIQVKTSDGLALEGWYFPPSAEMNKVIVFFHGNSWNIGMSYPHMKDYLDDGYGLVMAEYRGYAGHSGEVSEQGLYKDARAFIDWLHLENHISYNDMIFYGESLGGALAVKMASEYQPHAVVILASFSSILEFAEDQYPYVPVALILKDPYLNYKAIADVPSPVLILHGKQDNIIPYEYGKRLYIAANEPKKFVSFENGTHVNLYDLGARDVIRAFLGDLDEE